MNFDFDQKLPAGEQKKQITKKLIFIFFGAMLLLTFFSNTINNFTLPRVETEYPVSGSLVKEVLARGEIVPVDSQCEYTRLTATVKSIGARAGSQVTKGQLIMVLDSTEAMDAYQTELLNLNKMRLTLDKLNQEAPSDLNQTQYRKMAESRQKYEAAKDNYACIKALYDAGAESRVSLKTAEDSMRTCERDYKQAREDMDQAIKTSRREIQGAVYDLMGQQLKVDRLKRELDTKYELRAKCNGVLKEINFDPGTTTNSSKPLFVISNTDAGFEFKATVESDAANYLAAGDEAEVSLQSSSRQLQGTVTRLMNRGDGKSDVYVAVQAQDLAGGESGEAFINKSIGFYDALVSNSAIGKDSSGYFVWVVKERKGVFGNQFYVKKAVVNIGRSDNSKTAVQKGADSYQMIVSRVEDNRQLTDGCRVMLSD